MASRSVPGLQPPEFTRALASLRAARLRPEVKAEEAPAPARIAPYAVALTADVVDLSQDGEELATGRFVLLYDPSCPEPWAGPWRAVTYARATLEPEVGSDPFLGSVGWSWLMDALEGHDVRYVAEAGTVTRVVSESFGELSDRPATVQLEVRASWTPVDDIRGHVEAWGDLLCMIAGLPPLPAGVVALPGRRR